MRFGVKVETGEEWLKVGWTRGTNGRERMTKTADGLCEKKMDGVACNGWKC